MLGIDADVLLYRAAFAAQRELYKIYLKGEEESGYIASVVGKKAVNEWLKNQEISVDEVILESELEVDPPEWAFHSINHMIKGMCKALKDEEYILYLTGEGNFREKVLPSYKAGRPPKPVLYKDVKDFLIYNKSATIVHDMEADDALGIALVNGDIDILCTIDKDLDQVPGLHYDFVKESLYEVPDEAANEFYYAQLIAGDGVDNICGCKGIGVKTALKLLRKREDGDFDAVVEEQYKKQWGEDWREALECNKQLIKIKTS